MAIEFKTEPAVKRKISDINPNLDSRISIVGSIIGLEDSMLIIDDGTGKIDVSFSEETPQPELNTGQLIRVFGFVIPSEQVELQAEIIQDLTELKTEYLDIIRN